MSRSPKGTIQRAATIAEYANDLDVLYTAADDVGDAEKPMMRVHVQNTRGSLQCLQTLFSTMTGQNLTAEDNFFVQGIDSLQALLVVREIRQMFSIPQLGIGMLYAHPTMLSLVDALQQNTFSQSLSSSNTGDVSDASGIAATIEHFTKLIDAIPDRARA